MRIPIFSGKGVFWGVASVRFPEKARESFFFCYFIANGNQYLRRGGGGEGGGQMTGNEHIGTPDSMGVRGGVIMNWIFNMSLTTYYNVITDITVFNPKHLLSAYLSLFNRLPCVIWSSSPCHGYHILYQISQQLMRPHDKWSNQTALSPPSGTCEGLLRSDRGVP